MRRHLSLAILSIGVTCIAFGAGATYSYYQRYWNTLKPESVVAYLYTYTCSECGYDKAEGDYSFSVTNGYEFCPECGADRQYNHFEESSIYHK